MGMQGGWRWCRECFTLAYSGFGGGVCVEGAHDFTGSMEYFLSISEVPDGNQPDWKWCAQCQCLCYGGFGVGTWCAAGTQHDFSGSGAYSVPLDHVPESAQAGWRWCRTCLCLTFGEPGGLCTTRAAHDFSRSGAYAVPTAAKDTPDVNPTIAVETNSGLLIVRGDGFTPNGAVNIRYLNDGRWLDVAASANEIGRISHSAGYRRAEGSCTLMVRDESSGRFTAGSVAGWVPDNFPHAPVTIDRPHLAEGDPDPRYE